jgi:hypothetical protein
MDEDITGTMCSGVTEFIRVECETRGQSAGEAWTDCRARATCGAAGLGAAKRPSCLCGIPGARRGGWCGSERGACLGCVGPGFMCVTVCPLSSCHVFWCSGVPEFIRVV